MDGAARRGGAERWRRRARRRPRGDFTLDGRRENAVGTGQTMHNTTRTFAGQRRAGAGSLAAHRSRLCRRHLGDSFTDGHLPLKHPGLPCLHEQHKPYGESASPASMPEHMCVGRESTSVFVARAVCDHEACLNGTLGGGGCGTLAQLLTGVDHSSPSPVAVLSTYRVTKSSPLSGERSLSEVEQTPPLPPSPPLVFWHTAPIPRGLRSPLGANPGSHATLTAASWRRRSLPHACLTSLFILWAGEACTRLVRPPSHADRSCLQ